MSFNTPKIWAAYLEGEAALFWAEDLGYGPPAVHLIHPDLPNPQGHSTEYWESYGYEGWRSINGPWNSLLVV